MLPLLFSEDLDVSGELLDTTPPGVDEAVAISKVVGFLKAKEYSEFECIIFDTYVSTCATRVAWLVLLVLTP